MSMHEYVCMSMYEYVYGPLQDAEVDRTVWRKEKEKEKEKKREEKQLEKKEKLKK